MVIGVKTKSQSPSMRENAIRRLNRRTKLRRFKPPPLLLLKGRRKESTTLKLQRHHGIIKPWKMIQQERKNMIKEKSRSILLMRILKKSSKACLNMTNWNSMLLRGRIKKDRWSNLLPISPNDFTSPEGIFYPNKL